MQRKLPFLKKNKADHSQVFPQLMKMHAQAVVVGASVRGEEEQRTRWLMWIRCFIIWHPSSVENTRMGQKGEGPSSYVLVTCHVWYTHTEEPEKAGSSAQFLKEQ